MDTVIQVEGLSKRYRIGVKEDPPENLREAVGSLLGASFRYLRQMTRPPSEEETLWALKDVSFEVKQGEVLGIIGSNGAGKSTLLKILSRITEPTTGRAIINGRVGSLLEVGTGFHPELTGRENTYLNGAILGMKKREIDRKFDEIVAFAEVEKFIDTPVKRYSSGMYVRLAFAVAAHLEPEILIVDEVLAVGDTAFQKKCLGKMEDVSQQDGRTILFVSHNMLAITSLCQIAMLLEGGQVTSTGPVAEIVTLYSRHEMETLPEVNWTESTAPGNNVARILRVRACNEDGFSLYLFDIRRPIDIEVVFQVIRLGVWFTPTIRVHNGLGTILFDSVANIDPDQNNIFDALGNYRCICRIPGNFLAEGLFSVRVTLWGFASPPTNGVRIDDAIHIRVHDNLQGDSVRGKYTGQYPGLVRPKLEWMVERIDVLVHGG